MFFDQKARGNTILFDPVKVVPGAPLHTHTGNAGNLSNLDEKGFTGLISATSATRDLSNVMHYSHLKQLAGSGLQYISLVHGALSQQEKLSAQLNMIGFRNVVIPSRGDRAEFNP